jgi:CxxC motif-containing protein (DUF1111 family)
MRIALLLSLAVVVFGCGRTNSPQPIAVQPPVTPLVTSPPVVKAKPVAPPPVVAVAAPRTLAAPPVVVPPAPLVANVVAPVAPAEEHVEAPAEFPVAPPDPPLDALAALSAPPTRPTPPIDGKELFDREWIPNDPRSHAGDGLGPLFNETSCVACHNQGGRGGAGPEAKNAQLIAVIASSNALKPRWTSKSNMAAEREVLSLMHAGFGRARSIVLHRMSTDNNFAKIRRTLRGGDEQVGGSRGRRSSEAQGFRFVLSERNTPALFGSGAIDSIPDEVLVAAAARTYLKFPDVSGRVAKLSSGKIGRFGWKAQQGRLSEFVHTACAVELGLEVPGVQQATYVTATIEKSLQQMAFPDRPEKRLQSKLDLSQEQCNALVDFVAKLPAPRERVAASTEEAEYLSRGSRLFEDVGCAACHKPQLGEVAGIYSDLLLHDMGTALVDGAAYYGPSRNSTEQQDFEKPLPRFADSDKKEEPIDESKLTGATSREWRTPPLWGLRDSAPYLHDGRAQDVEQAIALHDGEAKFSAKSYAELPRVEQMELALFLRSLEAPK